MHNDIVTPFSVFPTIYDRYASNAGVILWHEVLDILRFCSQEPMQSKEDACLFNFVSYADGRRLQANATEAGAMILDIDHDLPLPDAFDILKYGGWESVLYSSASHDPAGTHKFRVIFPLRHTIQARDGRRVWDSLNSLFQDACDRSKRGEHSIFYLPGAYDGVANQFHHFQGVVWSAEDWMSAYPTEEPDAIAAASCKPTMLEQMKLRMKMRSRHGRSWIDDGVTLVPLSENPFVMERAVDDYLGNRGGWYHGCFAFLMSVAKVAHLKGYAISPGELVETFNALDALDGGYYQNRQDQRRLHSDAARAIQTVGGEEGQTMQQFEYDDIDALMGVEPSDLDQAFDDATTIRGGTNEAPSDTSRRAPKISKLPADYDPTLEYGALPEGHERPPIRCYVDRNVVQPIDLGDEFRRLSTATVATMGTRERKHHFLTQKCVSVRGTWYVKEKASGIWRPHEKKDAEAQLYHDWADCTQFNILPTTIREFFRDSKHLPFHQTIFVPGLGDFVRFEGKRCLNLGHHPPRSYDPQCAASREFELLLRVINENLLAEPAKSVEEILEEVEGPKESATKWVFRWLASVYQRPGLHIGTNLWFVGSQQGVGKGLLSDAMIWLVGEGNGRKVHASELGGEWNDFIEGNVLLIGDEVTMASKKGFNDMLKSFVANEVIALRKRNVGQYNIPNVSNWLFTTNNPKPVTIDQDDRRNTFIATREDIEARALARQFGELSPNEKQRAYQGLAALLHSIDIDDRLIRRAIDTPLKETLKFLGARPVRLWFGEADLPAQHWSVGEFCSSVELFEDFSHWASRNGFHQSVTNQNAFRLEMSELEKKGYVRGGEREVVDGSKKRGFRKLRDMEPTVMPQFGLDVPEASTGPEYPRHSGQAAKGESNIIKLKEQLRKKQ